MLGLSALFIAALWLLVAVGLAIFLSQKLASGWARTAVGVLLLVLIAPLPVLDEVVAKHQFQRLCAQNSAFQLDRPKAVGRTIYLARVPDEDVEGTWVRVVRQPRRFIDSTTGALVISYDRFVAAGGRLSQFFGVEGRVPILFSAVCDSGHEHNIDGVIKDLNITLVRKP